MLQRVMKLRIFGWAWWLLDAIVDCSAQVTSDAGDVLHLIQPGQFLNSSHFEADRQHDNKLKVSRRLTLRSTGIVASAWPMAGIATKGAVIILPLSAVVSTGREFSVCYKLYTMTCHVTKSCR